MRWRTPLLATLVVALVAASAGPVGAAGAAPRLGYLDPAGQPRLTEKVPVNVVFLGYTPAQANRSRFLAGLAKSYEPVVRSRLSYGVTEKLGITYTYDYRLTYPGRAYQDSFFGQLGRLAEPAPLTAYQQAYNDQQHNVLDVTANHTIDAPSVEKWLALHPPAGVDTRRNTVYFINWYGRSDFKFHVYSKTGEPDPDTGYDFGANRDSRKIIAWGGTTADDEETGLGATRRVWFHDLSAGPESWTSNYDVDNADVDGDGVPDYRMPPTWEYTEGGYRDPAELAGDLARITRYVALNLLMTTSPLYPVELPGAGLPRAIDVDSNTYEGWPGVDASTRYLRPDLVTAELSELRWRNRISTDQQDLPYTAENQACYVAVLNDESCFPETGYPAVANLYLYQSRHLDGVLDGDAGYEVPVFNYAVAEGVGVPGLGYAAEDYRTGDQTYVFNFISPEVVELGYGLTTTQIHEVGHHLGMSHPHDGYDSATGVDYAPSGEFQFANAGDENNSMMSYIDLNWDFSQFDRDNSDRFLTAAYWEAANRVAATVPAGRGRTALKAADALLGLAVKAFAAHRYRAAYALAEQAYATVARIPGAQAATVATQLKAEADAARRTTAVHDPHEFIDTLDPQSPRSQP
ncbi:hypothetical protein [Actinoplanes teichomyceticus]|uniref:Peptidase M43 pregnancy-associated plasma-A domain-containing protein n=1 Tax=Actinoplanes teichomyceticus TaxID=1867 RepID=A0A561WLC3_ACTTI|nr:hypothetical protein [Actinoplanes teichomyceticus]TWG24668.1 hypothetical protein FHX34_1021228 [Actinoplanes teichomyceticus]GIF14669.1 hypothetical protein Ate01nite_47010 [Actinoplanes teichomyceticus]